MIVTVSDKGLHIDIPTEILVRAFEDNPTNVTDGLEPYATIKDGCVQAFLEHVARKLEDDMLNDETQSPLTAAIDSVFEQIIEYGEGIDFCELAEE